MVRLIAADMDGTLLNDEKELPDETISVIRASLKIAMLFLKNPSAKVFLLGGWLRFTEPSTFGDVTINQLKGFHVNKTILSVAGLSAEYGLTEYLEEDAAIKRQALQCGEKKIVLIDQTKLDVTALLTVAPIEQVDQIYVDGCDTDPRICAIREKGIHVICIPHTSGTQNTVAEDCPQN